MEAEPSLSEKPFSAEVEREGADYAELVGAYPSGSHKQNGSVVERLRSPSFVAVADDVRVNCPTFRSSPAGVGIVRNSVIG